MINFFFKKNIKINQKNMLKKKIFLIAYLEKKKIYILNYIFCNNKYILNINKKYLKKIYFTDIITFNYSNKKNIIYGDIFISVDQVYINSKIFNVKFSKEIKRVIIHGILHLFGYNDNNKFNRKEMKYKEDFYINYLKNIKISK
ncbi:MAG: rRNA maturation RNase YbeY [Candidatus Shikimatogenerans bostrichidophilus]|nr:MAG: rRNA maturation RNase YbeY [Candidatus Shikimatogenerans bostrichidophilus]